MQRKRDDHSTGRHRERDQNLDAETVPKHAVQFGGRIEIFKKLSLGPRTVLDDISGCDDFEKYERRGD